MVNPFIVQKEKENVAKRTPTELRILQILEARHNLREAYEIYNLRKAKRQQTLSSFIIMRVRLKTLIFEIEGWLKREYKAEEYNKLLSQLESNNPERVLNLLHEINTFLDSHNLLKVDMESSDTRNPVYEDYSKGYG